MLNSRKDGLMIFDRFITDYELPKHTIKKAQFILSSDVALDDFQESDMDVPQTRTAVGGSMWLSPNDFNEAGTPSDNNKVGIVKKISDFFKGKEKEQKPKISVQDFFKAIKTSAINLEEYTSRVNDYINALKYAKQLNQAALVDEIQKKIDQAKFESILYASNFRTVITEEQVVKFYKESPKGLELTWIRNYIRIIPEKAAERKKEADAQNVFDNYVILHYDPQKKAFKEEEKDPILFGVINGIRKLYYISDWVDEYCDLTLEQFIDKFGQDAIKANDLTVKYKL